MANKQFKLEQTKNHFKVQGIVTRIEGEKAYRQGVSKNGNQWRSIRFGVQTSEDNEVFVELFGITRDRVYASKYNAETKKSEGQFFSWEQRHNLPEGYTIFDTSLKLDPNAERAKGYTAFDAVMELRNNLKEGDSVYISGSIEFSEFQGKLQKRFLIGYVSKLKNPVDFGAKNFKEVSHFELGMIVMGLQQEKQKYGDEIKDVTKITGRSIYYGDNFADGEFVIHEDIPELKILAKSARKVLRPYDHVVARGKIVNKVIQTKVEAKPELNMEQLFAGGIDDDVFEPKANKEYISELQIIKLDSSSYVRKKYTEEDFKAVQLVKEEETKKNKKEPDLFEGGLDDDSDNNAIDLDDLFS